MSNHKPQPDKEDQGAAHRQRALVREEVARQALSPHRDQEDAVRESQGSARDVDSVTYQMAIEQELDTLRRTVRDKERLVEATAAQCRRVEDELEDQHLAYDGLKQDLGRTKRSLSEARDQAVRKNEEFRELEERYKELLSSRQRVKSAENLADRRRSGIAGGSTARFSIGLVMGVLFAVIAFVAWVQLYPRFARTFRSTDAQEVAVQAEALPRSANATTGEDTSAVIGEELAEPAVLGTVRDRLKDGSTGPLMLELPSGSFTMGKQQALPNDDAVPAHDVLLDGFLIGATEVTFEEYDRFARDTGRRFPSDFGWGRGTRPVVDVSWWDARSYADWLSERTGQAYRLPSESEWEYAAAGGRRTFFWWGDQVGQGRAVCFDCGTIWDNRSSAPVGSFLPNPYGLYDTAGNVMEWVEDCYHPSYVDAPQNGQPRDMSNCPSRVARGGAFNKPARSMRSTTREHFAPETRMNALGFRVVRDE